MTPGTTRSTREQFTFVIVKAQKNVLSQELKSLLFATDNPTIAYDECDRLNMSRTSKEHFADCISYQVEKIPSLSRRKSRHPFMRGGQRELFNPDENDKDGNVAESEVKFRGKIVRELHVQV